MPPRKPYNPDTAYGRKKLREESQKYRESLPPDEQAKMKGYEFWILFIIAAIAMALYYATGDKAILKWLSH